MDIKPGINHIEFWVSDLARSLAFYRPLFAAIGWHQRSEAEFGSGSSVVYFIEKPVGRVDGVGPRHLCFHATSRAVVETVPRRVASNLPGGSSTLAPHG